jgi:hypothetical protein
VLPELSDADLAEVITATGGERVVSIDPDAVGAIRAVPDSRR